MSYKLLNSQHRPILLILGSLGLITYLHYTTAPGLSRMHVVYRYCYFLPIIYAALRYGYRGGLLSALLASILSAPHIFFKWGEFPEEGLNDLLIVVIFYGVSLLTGITVDRLRQAQRNQALMVEKLEASLRQLARQDEELRRAHHLSALGMLAGGLAHEIRNPVGIIRACAQLLAMENRPEILESTNVIQQETGRIETLIQELLDYAGSQQLAPVPTAIAPLLQRVSDRVSPLTSAYEITLCLQIAPNLPTIHLDPEQLERALLNLCMNSIQALADHGRLTLTATWIEDQTPYLEIRVIDSGPGILPIHQSHIFEPFYSTKDGGMGLGLSVVHRIITDHGGRIHVESTPSQGTTFVIQLPEYFPATPNITID